MRNKDLELLLPILVFWGLGGKLYSEYVDERKRMELAKMKIPTHDPNQDDYTCTACYTESKDKFVFRINWRMKMITRYTQFCSMECFRGFMGYPPHVYYHLVALDEKHKPLNPIKYVLDPSVAAKREREREWEAKRAAWERKRKKWEEGE